MKRGILIFIFVLLLGGLAGLVKFWSSHRPNIIFIMVDTLRVDYLGCYGFQGQISPHIDAFAKKSVLFRNAITQAPWTKPAIASLFTSLHPQTHQVINPKWPPSATLVDKTEVLSGEANTLAEILKDRGYKTIAIVGNDWIDERFGFAQGFDEYKVMPRVRHLGEDLIDESFNWFKESKNDGSPIFFYIHFMDVHGPYVCQEDDFNAVSGSPTLGQDRPLSVNELSTLPKYLKKWAFRKNPDRAKNLINWKTCYAAGIRRFDRQLDRFLKTLQQGGWLKDSLIILTSDHGEEFLEHNAWGHGKTLCRHQIHVPLLIHFPESRYAGKTVEEVVSLVDLWPTIAKMVGVRKKTGAQKFSLSGRDLMPLLEGDKREERWAYSNAVKGKPNILSIQNEKFKLVWDYPKEKLKLFNLDEDINEKIDFSSEYPKMLQRVKKQARQHVETLRKAGSLGKEAASMTEETIENLKSIGYLQ